MREIRDDYVEMFESTAMKLGFHWPWQVLLAIAHNESDMNPDAKGPTNDHGLFQFTEAAWRDAMGGLPFMSYVYDPRTATEGAIRYIHKLDQWVMDAVPSDVVISESDRLAMIMAAYNGGIGYVRKAISLLGHDVSWARVSHMLAARECRVAGKRVHVDAVRGYVNRFFETLAHAFIKYPIEGEDNIKKILEEDVVSSNDATRSVSDAWLLVSTPHGIRPIHADSFHIESDGRWRAHGKAV